MYNAIFLNLLGLPSLSTSVFGGIVIGLLTAFLYNKFKNIQLPKMIGFFSGVRFIPIVVFGASLVVSLLFSMAWPIIGLGLFYLGQGLSKGGQYGDTFVYGFLNRALVPFGLHHVLNTMLWFSSIGGQLDLNKGMVIQGQTLEGGLYSLYNTGPTIISGDINIQIYLMNILGRASFMSSFGDLTTFPRAVTMQDIINSYGEGIMPGQYTNFAYVFTLFALPAAAFAMAMAAPKGDNRKLAISIVASGGFTSFLVGISEPIEFTFLFLAP
jgi:PTS system glucose-specific IIC component